jgi:cobalt-zinc-cadmium efflux system outer membrane protein
MKFKIYLKAFFISVIFNATAFSQILTEKEVIESAMLLHPNMLAVQQEIESAKGELKSSEGGFDPVLRYNSLDFLAGNYNNSGYLDFTVEQPTSLYGMRFIAGYRRSDGRLPDYYDQEITQIDGEVRAGVEIPILRDGLIDRRRANLKKAEIQQILANAVVEQREIELTRAARNSYYDWIAAGKRYKIANQLYKNTLDRQKQLEERAKKGDIANFDVIDNQRSVLQRKSFLISTERQLAQARFELSIFLRDLQTGEPILVSDSKMPGDFPLTNSLMPLSLEMNISKAYENRPDLKRIEQLKNQNKIELDLAENQVLPKLDAQLLSSQDLGVSQPKYDETEFRAGIKFEFPLFNRSAVGKLESISAKQKELEYTYNFLKDRIKADLLDVLTAIRLAKERIEISKNEFATAEQVEKGELERFYLGDSNLVFVNLREQTTADSGIRVVDAKLDYLKANAALSAITAEKNY